MEGLPFFLLAPYRYLPFSAYAIAAPLTFLAHTTAYWCWVALLELLLGACVVLTLRIGDAGAWRFVGASMWLLFTPLYPELYMGQWSFLMAALMFFTALALVRGGASRAGWHGASRS